MEVNNEIQTPKANLIKIKDIQTNFKNAKRLSPLKNQPLLKKKKSVMFLEPSKHFRAETIKKNNIIKTNIIKSTNNLIEQTFKTEISNRPKTKKSKNNIKTVKVKHEKKKMPKLKTKVVNINKHYYMPIIAKYEPSTLVSNNNDNKKSKNYKRLKTSDKNFKATEDFNSNTIKKMDIKKYQKMKSDKNINSAYQVSLYEDISQSNNNKNYDYTNKTKLSKMSKISKISLKSMIKNPKDFITESNENKIDDEIYKKTKNDNESDNDIYENKEKIRSSNIKQQIRSSNIKQQSKQQTIKSILKQSLRSSNIKQALRCSSSKKQLRIDNSSNLKSQINFDNQDENKNKDKDKDNNNNNNNEKKDGNEDNLTQNKVNTYKQSNSVDGTPKMRKKNFIRKLFCCLSGI